MPFIIYQAITFIVIGLRIEHLSKNFKKTGKYDKIDIFRIATMLLSANHCTAFTKLITNNYKKTVNFKNFIVLYEQAVNW